MTRRAIGRRVFMVAIAGISAFAAQGALAQKKSVAKAEVLVIHAETVPGAAAPDAPLGLKQLKNPPFNAYNKFTQVGEKHSLALDPKAAPKVTLPNNAALTLLLKIDGAGAQTIVPSLSGSELPPVAPKVDEPFFIAGQSYKGGIIIVAVTPRG